MRLIFFGTPEFAVPALLALVGEGFDVAGVITQPDKPQGRSRSVLVPPPVKVAAEREGLPVLQPERPSSPEAIEQIRSFEPDLGIVVAYGHILKPALLAVPSRGMLNIHASLLPALRGAAPIQHAILRGDDVTGVSIMQMDEGMDSGPVLLQAPTPIAPDETFGELHNRLAEAGALAIVEGLTLLEVGRATFEAQDESQVTYAPKITRELTRIDWNASTLEIHRKIRAFDPAPGAWTELDGKAIKLFGPRTATADGDAPPGAIAARPGELIVATADGALSVAEVQPAGKRRTPAAAWLRGRGGQGSVRFE